MLDLYSGVFWMPAKNPEINNKIQPFAVHRLFKSRIIIVIKYKTEKSVLHDLELIMIFQIDQDVIGDPISATPRIILIDNTTLGGIELMPMPVGCGQSSQSGFKGSVGI